MSNKKPSVVACVHHGWHESIVAGRCELCKAITAGDLEGVKSWLTPENMESKGRRGWTPLVFAVRAGQVDILRYLVSVGANIHTIDKRGQSLLHHVTDSLTITGILLESGIDANHRAKFGITPLHTANAKHLDVVRFLLESGADVCAINTVGRPPHVILNREVSKIPLLLEYFGNASVMCKRAGCRCQKTMLMCSYYKAIKHRSMYEQHIIKISCAGLPLDERNQLMNSQVHVPEPFISQRETFLTECLAELERMKRDIVTDDVTYFCIFNQQQSALRNIVVQQTLTPEFCKKMFPIYGETLRCRLVTGWRKWMLFDEAVDSFLVHVQLLPPECVARVFSYLENEDLKTLCCACTGLKNLKRICQTPMSEMIKNCKRAEGTLSEADGQMATC